MALGQEARREWRSSSASRASSSKKPVRGTETSTDLVLFVAQSWVCDVVVTYAGPGGPEWPARVEKSLADGEVLVIPSKP